MAVTMSSATVNQDLRNSMQNMEVDSSFQSGGATGGLFGGESLAGITPNFATNVTSAIEDYISGVNNILEKMTGVQNNVAFKGAGVEQSLNSFIEKVKTVSLEFTDALKNAETQIINEVASVYGTQDTDISGDLHSDASSLGKLG